MTERRAAATGRLVQLATFLVGGEEYALDIMRIKEIINPLKVTPVPKVPAFIEGVIELRGAIIPIVDLRKRFDLPPTPQVRATKYIIVAIEGRIVGLVVDAVGEVLRLTDSEVKPPPELQTPDAAGLFSGVCRLRGRILMILDIDRMLSSRERLSLAGLPPRVHMTVVVAHELEEIREAALRIVHELGWDAVGATDGGAALAAVLAQPTPSGLIIDVALPGRAAYEVVDEIRARELPVKVVLVASVYSKTAYKRRPTSLYGADDYVEQHHITDTLGDKLARLLGGAAGPGKDSHDPLSLTPAEHEELARIRAASEAQLVWPEGGGAAEAQRIARVIVCDLLLYNGAAVADALMGAGHAEIERRLARDLDAARGMLGRCVPADLRAGGDLVAQALAELLRKVEERHQRLHERTRSRLRGPVPE